MGFAKVWTHKTKPELQTNSILGDGYECEEHEVSIDDVAQKVIVPERYFRHLKPFFKLSIGDIADVLRYHAG